MFLFRTKYVMLLSVILGLAASFSVFRYLKMKEETLKEPDLAVRKVIVASGNLRSGTKLSVENLKTSLWPEDIIPQGYFGDLENLTGRVVENDIVNGEPILESKLAAVGSDGGISIHIPDGMRAITVAVNIVSGVSGFILPNSKVDVLATVDLTGNKREAITKMILQNIKILAVDQEIERDGDEPVTVQSVTLLVSPEEAEKLTLASSQGQIQLTLRNTIDSNLYETPGTDLTGLMHEKRRVVRRKVVSRSQGNRPFKVQPPTSKIVEVIRANVRSEQTFEEEREEISP